MSAMVLTDVPFEVLSLLETKFSFPLDKKHKGCFCEFFSGKFRGIYFGLLWSLEGRGMVAGEKMITM